MELASYVCCYRLLKEPRYGCLQRAESGGQAVQEPRRYNAIPPVYDLRAINQVTPLVPKAWLET